MLNWKAGAAAGAGGGSSSGRGGGGGPPKPSAAVARAFGGDDDGDSDAALLVQLKQWHAQAVALRDAADSLAVTGDFEPALRKWKDAIQLLTAVVADAVPRPPPPQQSVDAAAAAAIAAAAAVADTKAPVAAAAAAAAAVGATDGVLPPAHLRSAEVQQWVTRIVELCAVLHEQSSQALLELNRTFPAIQSAEEAVRLRPDWAVALVTLGRAQLEHGEPQMSLDTMTRAAALDPHNRAQSDAADELQRVTAVLENMHLHMAQRALSATADAHAHDHAHGHGHGHAHGGSGAVIGSALGPILHAPGCRHAHGAAAQPAAAAAAAAAASASPDGTHKRKAGADAAAAAGGAAAAAATPTATPTAAAAPAPASAAPADGSAAKRHKPTAEQPRK